MMIRFAVVPVCLFALAFGCNKKKADPVVEPGAAPTKTAPDADKAWDQAVADLKGKTNRQRAAALRVITQYEATHAIPVLVGALNDKTYSESEMLSREPNSAREAAILGLQRFGKEGEKAIAEKGLPLLKSALKDSDPGVKLHALLALALLGPIAKPASGDVLLLCEEKDQLVRQTAFETLGKIGGANPLDFGLMLGNADPKIVYDAARAINAVRPLPKEIVPLMIAAIEKPVMNGEAEELGLARQEIAEALAGLGADAEAAVPVLISQMKGTSEEEFSRFFRPRPDKTTGIRTDESPTMAALRRIGKPAVPALIEILGEDKAFATWQAARVLAGIGPDSKDAIPALQKIFEKEGDRLDSDVLMMTACGLAMVQAGADSEPIVAKLAELLTIANPLQRWEVSRALAYFGRKGAPAANAIAKLLDDQEEIIREQAVLTLTAFGPGAKEAVPALAKRLSDESFDVRRGATLALKSLGPIAVAAGPELSKLLVEPDEALRRDVIEAIAAIGPGGKADVARLSRLATSPDERDRLAALDALGAIGPEAKPAVTDLVSDLKTGGRNGDNRAAIATAIGRIGAPTPDAVQALGGALLDSSMQVRVAAAKALAKFGPAAKGAAEALKKFGNNLQTPDTVGGVWAAAAQYKIGINADASLNYLIASLKNHAPTAKQARLAAMDASVLLGPGAKGLVPELLASLADPSPISAWDQTPVGIRAAQALGKMGPAAKEAVIKLTVLLKEQNPARKKAIIETLGEIGPDASHALARLREIARTEPAFAELALAAIERIESKQ
jgi:HEAT repeat protein